MNSTTPGSRFRRLSSQRPEFRSTSMNNRVSPSLAAQSSTNRSQIMTRDPPVTRTSYSPIKERHRTSPFTDSKIPQIKGKTIQVVDKPHKKSDAKSPKVFNDLKSSQVLSRVEAEKFSPYVAPRREGEERKEKVISSSKLADLSKPKNYASTPDTLALKTLLTSKEPEYFTFVLGKGNNDRAVRTVMAKRYWWKETYAGNSVFDFCWHQTNKPINFTTLCSGKSVKRVANHFEFNREIGIKSNLLKNLQVYCERNSMDLFKITPITFTLDLMSSNYTNDYKVFKNCFKDFTTQNHEDHSKKQEDLKSSLVIESQKSPSKPKKVEETPKPRQGKLPDTYYSGCNLWLLKPTDYNRGRGINLFNKLSTLEHYLKCFKNGEDQPDQKGGSSSPGKVDAASSMSIVKSHKFVVQKYIEKPMLIQDRKFDVRVWVLIDQDMNLYYFKEGYIRLSSEVFSLDEKTIEDKYVHLTNNAVQKYSKNYGKLESGNIISLKELEAYLPKQSSGAIFTKIKERMKELIRISMDSVKNKLNAAERKHSFEVFGYDFILDAEYNVWIIEVNSNPSIDESNGLLRAIVPRMLDDTFRLTIDKIFQPTKKNYKPEDLLKEDVDRQFKVNGYSDDENLWEYLTCLKKPQPVKK